MEYLVFRLYGPMASWGEAAVGGDRPSASYPSRSAILGLLSAALGIRREQQSQLHALQQSICCAVKQSRAGVLLRDYHTVQVPSHNKKLTLLTRKDELAIQELNTVLSSRDYRSEGIWTIAIWLNQGAVYTLEQLSQALKQPVFTLSLGRKSCPLALPLQPKVIVNNDLKTALDTEFPPLLATHQQDQQWIKPDKTVSYFWQGAISDMALSDVQQQQVQTLQRWDEPIDRLRWQFTTRFEHQITLKETQ